jgi:membrane protein DedA with SNARE-associated domain
MVSAFISNIFSAFLDNLTYPAIVILMAIESSIFPLPSEIIIPPAAHLAYTYHAMSLTGVILAGTLGSWIGASIMYWISRIWGTRLILRWGKFILIDKKKIDLMKNWFEHYGELGVFTSRLIPVVRHLIGIPAGIAKMNYFKFSAYTIIGAAIWCAILSFVGIKAGQDAGLMQGQLHSLTIWIIGAFAILWIVYYLFVKLFLKKDK